MPQSSPKQQQSSQHTPKMAGFAPEMLLLTPDRPNVAVRRGKLIATGSAERAKPSQPSTPEVADACKIPLPTSRSTHTPNKLKKTPPTPSTPRTQKAKSPLSACLKLSGPLRLFRKRQQFRCDIDATSAEDYRSAEAECKQMIVEAGGSIVEGYIYIGGFLFELPNNTKCPIESGDATALGGSIVVENWIPFDQERGSSRSPTKLNNESPTERRIRFSDAVDRPVYSIEREDTEEEPRRSPPAVLQRSGILLSKMLLEEAWKSGRHGHKSCSHLFEAESESSGDRMEDVEDAATWETLTDISSDHASDVHE